MQSSGGNNSSYRSRVGAITQVTGSDISMRNENCEKFLKVVSRSGASSILFELDRNPMRFSQLMFKTKLNPGILDRHLKALIEYSLVTKENDAYTLTNSGKKLAAMLDELFAFFTYWVND